jgi:hypothetical protein
MYVTGMGRCSGALHLAVQFPKIAACLCALGITSWTMTDAEKVTVYCHESTAANYAAIPETARADADEVCFCLEGQCGTMK